ncbi:MAG: hypothetical protein ABI867_12235 [Kofleriaceae bacterium]
MRRLLIIGLAIGLSGCVTPSIPIPPPDPGKMTFQVDTTGPTPQAVFTYEPEANYIGSIVFIYNRDRGVGIIENAAADGSVGPTAPVEAAVGEEVVITFEREDQTVSTCVRLREGAQSSTDYCGF